ncbi:uncharacterized protein EI97DRAFT_370148 [Westerdykella ornata]|uniref:Uncharacterized protein n=1 Tax=Westerdykella ornata TaxID=318751 RepID=A0A6A6JS42_WESOR|nr:uncharacterized protein EI97DRAFT_370148 [Westerdykella ornata]KAF2279382.1 hypothetical protein EI97DRAFT_370148 [Westerdykella ornata]
MCHGNSTRASQGGSIAVLRAPQCHLLSSASSSSYLGADEEWRLHFFNRAGTTSSCGTEVTLQGTRSQQRERYKIIIHRDGDLTSAASPTLDECKSRPLFSFSLHPDHYNSTLLPQKLDLGVGDSGIIGRRVSVMTDSGAKPTSVAVGIIGWN